MGRAAIGILGAAVLVGLGLLLFGDRLLGPGGDGEGGTVLRVANWGGPAVDPAFLAQEREIREAFEQAHPGVRVQIENIPGPGQYVPKLLMTFVAGNPPDVLCLDASSAAVFIDNGLLADLAPLVEAEASFDLDRFFPNVVDIARRGDRVYAVPMDFTPMVMIYNRRLLREAGVAEPKAGWSRDEFLEAARALTVRPAGGGPPAQYGFKFENWMPGWLPWIWAAGGDVLSPDGRRAVGYLDSPATREAIRLLADLVLAHGVAPNLSETAAAGVDLFRHERAAMTLTGHWSLIEYKRDGLDIGVASIPGTGGRRVTVMYEAGLAISRTSPHRDLAWRYVRYMASPAVQKRRLAQGLAISAERSVARSFAGEAVEDAFLAEVPFARPPWGARVARYERVEDLGREMMEDILGGVPVADAVARTARLVEAELGRR